MQAVKLKQVDNDYRNHLQAFLNFAVKAEKKVGKKSIPVFKRFKKFYNYKEEIDKALKGDENSKNSRYSGIGKLLK